MDNPLITDFKEELKREGLNGDEIKQCIKILKDIYIGQNIYVGHGILRHDFYKFGTKPISLLLEHDYIEEVQWYSHHLYHTTEKGSKIGRIVVTNLIDEKKSELEGFLNKQPQKDLNFVIQEHIVKSKYEKFTYSVHARDLSVLEPNNWIKPFIVDGRIHIAWTSVLFRLEVLGLCVRTNNYVSTRGGELREENYVISSEVFDFLVENCPEKSLTEEEYENCKLYDVLQYCYRYQERPLDVFRDTYWDRLRDVRLEEEKVKKAIDTMEEMGITSEYRGLLSSEAPFSIKDKSRYCIWLEKTLKEPIIESLLELSQGMSTEPPKLKVSPNFFDFGDVKQGDTPSHTFTVKNAGGRALNWEASDYPGWLDVSTIGGTNDGSFTVTVRSEVSIGDYDGTVKVISNDGSELIDVSVHIGEITPPSPSDLKILLGYATDWNSIYWEPDGTNEKTKMVSGNILITGGAGSGKTETLKSILYELNNRGYICLALGFHPDLRIDGFKFLQITAKSDIGVNPLDFDSLDEEGGGLPIQVYNVIERLKYTYPSIRDIQEANLIDILEEAYKRKGITEDKETWKKTCPNFEDVEKILNEKISETSDKELLRLKIKLSKIFKFKIFSKSDIIDTKELFKESTILDLSKLPEDFLFLVSDTILRKMYRNLKLREPIEYEAKGKERFKIFIAIDEAIILVPSKKDDSKAIINIFGTKARKFGVGFIVSSQLTAHFGDDVLGNMATKIALKPLKHNIAQDNAKELSIDPKVLMNIKNPGEGFIRFSNEETTKKLFIKSYEERKN